MPNRQTKGYQVMLAVTLMAAIGSFAILWINLIFDPIYFLKNPFSALGWSAGCLASGMVCLICFSVYFKDGRKLTLEKRPEPKWKPIPIQLHTDSEGRVLSVYLKAVQKNPNRYRDMKDYKVTIHYAKNGEIVPRYRSLLKRRKLREHLRLKLHDLPDEFFPQPHPSLWNIAG